MPLLLILFGPDYNHSQFYKEGYYRRPENELVFKYVVNDVFYDIRLHKARDLYFQVMIVMPDPVNQQEI